MIFSLQTRNTKLYGIFIIDFFFFILDKSSYIFDESKDHIAMKAINDVIGVIVSKVLICISKFLWGDRNMSKDTYPLVVALKQ